MTPENVEQDNPATDGLGGAPLPFIAAPPLPGAHGMIIFISVIFLSAFLLFQVQPVIARYILPWYGGSPAVWTTCLLFFQVGLLGGYTYAHGLVSLLREKRKLQIGIHLVLVGLAVFLLPITPSPDLKPDASGVDPVFGIVRLLFVTVGFPYLLLSATGPLLQHWFSEIYPNRSPFRLYAVSNLGSLLGLLTYPFFFEPKLMVSQQTVIWSGAFIVFGLLAAGAGFFFLYATKGGTARNRGLETEAGEAIRPAVSQVFQWIAFSACGSMLLLSLTSQMCQDVAVTPFLWVVPLSLYLLTFVIAFDHSRWYFRPFAIPAALVSIAVTVFLMNRQYQSEDWPLVSQIAIYCSAIFFGCLICHGEVVRLKPHTRYITGFYLAISLGGAIGGLFVSLVSPFIFNGYWELHIAFGLLAVLTTYRLFLWLDPFGRKWRSDTKSRTALGITGAVAGGAVWLVALVGLALGLRNHFIQTKNDVIASSRGFYGVLQVTEDGKGTNEAQRSLYHGRINHGRQYLDTEYRRMPTTYYSIESGIGQTFKYLPQRMFTPPTPIHVGVIGLGVGTVATYALPGDRFRFYEINPQVEDFARSHFTFLADCPGQESVVLGDGRISLERELARGENQEFDLLIVDAFSGDSIPIHLLTREAFELYFQHLKPNGVLAVHTTNRHLDLSDPIRNIVGSMGRQAYRIVHDPGESGYFSDWILIANDTSFLSSLRASGRVSNWTRVEPKPTLWTDNYSNLFEAIR
jgi:hypothetical protein